MKFLARKSKRPVPPSDLHHYHLLGTLRRFAIEVGFSLPVIGGRDDNGDNRSTAQIRVHVYRNGVKQEVWEPTPDPNRRNYVAWQSDWEGPDDANVLDEDLIAVEYVGPALTRHRAIEAQIMWRRRGASEYGTVIIETVRLRPVSSRFSPIIHTAYYYSAADPRENFTYL